MPTAARTPNFEAQSPPSGSRFLALLDPCDPPCVSIYTMMEPGRWATDRNFRKMEYLLQNAERQLATRSPRSAEPSELLAPARQFIEREKLTLQSRKGLALFIARNQFRHYDLLESVPEGIDIGRQFFVRPLLPLLSNDHFFLLALSQDRVRLFEGSSLEFKELKVEGVRENLRQDFVEQSFERERQFHSASPAIMGKQSAVFHGPHLQQKDRILHFFRDMDKGISATLKGQAAPLVLAAVHYLIPIYQKVNSYPHLIEGGILGNPDYQAEDSLYAAARKILLEHANPDRQSALKMYSENVKTRLTSSNLREVIGAAEQGRVRFLLLLEGAEQWGAFVAPDNVHVHTAREIGDDELLNLAAILTLRHRGQVFVVAPESLPEAAPLAAVYRF